MNERNIRMSTRKTATNSSETSNVKTENASKTVSSKSDARTNTQKSTPKKLPLDMMVACTNMTSGSLIYISSRQMGYKIEWEREGDVEYIELAELVTMRNSQRAFFEKGWISIDDPKVIQFLRVDNYYKGMPSIEDYEDLFTKSDDEIKAVIESVAPGFREIIANKAYQMINDGVIDSRKTIAMLKEELGLDIE